MNLFSHWFLSLHCKLRFIYFCRKIIKFSMSKSWKYFSSSLYWWMMISYAQLNSKFYQAEEKMLLKQHKNDQYDVKFTALLKKCYFKIMQIIKWDLNILIILLFMCKRLKKLFIKWLMSFYHAWKMMWIKSRAIYEFSHFQNQMQHLKN